MMLLPILIAMQVTPVAPIVKGTALPPPAIDEAAVLVPINGLFEGLARRDGAIMLAHIRPEGSATVLSEKADGTRSIRHMSPAEYAAGVRPGPERYEERLIDPAIDVAGDIAMVWGRYVFLYNGEARHCGTNHFDLIRESGNWKILNVTWTSRSVGCSVK